MEVYMNRIPKAVYTKEFREEAVKLAMTEGVCVSEAARRVSISMKTVANCVRAAKAGKVERVGQHKSRRRRSNLSSGGSSGSSPK
jgi:transposase